MQNRPELRLPPPKQTVRMDLTAIMKEVLADAPVKTKPAPAPQAAPTAALTQGAPAAQTKPLTLAEFDDLYTRLFSRFRSGLGLNAPQWNALRHTSFALAVGGLVDGDGESVLRFLNRVRERARVHIEGQGGYRLSPIQLRLVNQMLNSFRTAA